MSRESPESMYPNALSLEDAADLSLARKENGSKKLPIDRTCEAEYLGAVGCTEHP